jgi:thiamine biosynthesis lipoprotein
MSEPSKTSRRDFLKGQSAVEAIGDALIGPPQPLPPPHSTVGVQPGSHLLSVSREAMACLFEIVFDAATYRDGTDTAVESLELIARLEDQLTIYRDTSEVANINRRAFEEPVVVERDLFELFKRSVELSRATGGAFDITAGKLSKTWGFFRRQGQMPSPADVTAAVSTVGSQHLLFDDAGRSIRFTQPDLELNLGAIGKGYTLDRVAEALTAGGLNNFLIHGGNSSVLARGGRENSEFRTQNSEFPAWSVGLRHPLKPEVRLAEFFLHNQALGTSGSGTQFFHHQGKRYGHILDPRNGWPAEQVLSATVIASTAEQADALSTAFYVGGLELAERFCQLTPTIAALMITQTQAAGGIELHPVNLPDVSWRKL